MLRLLLNDGNGLIAWAERVIGIRFFPDARAIGWGVNDDVAAPDADIRGVAVYDRWTETDCHVHLASNGTGLFGAKAFLAAGFAFPFVEADRRRVTGLVPADNARALRLNQHLGFRQEGVMRNAGPSGQDIIVLGMLRSECRFIPLASRQGVSHGR
ncbi:GNAT family N-acetyltransferase [Sphingobium sufflavum]|uniref:GNAT family N-acetyltransferase n=1 Tax=Sphingobium sufflavum TaxID=1129547 RepID=UPI001F46B98F|nr:GNAT family protein [Sphingobium sufflavum]MCE7797851.1 GNAT family N-acetyltransferase [Sphingobium sufflavum]